MGGDGETAKDGEPVAPALPVRKRGARSRRRPWGRAERAHSGCAEESNPHRPSRDEGDGFRAEDINGWRWLKALGARAAVPHCFGITDRCSCATPTPGDLRWRRGHDAGAGERPRMQRKLPLLSCRSPSAERPSS